MFTYLLHSSALHSERNPERHLALPGAELEARLRVARGVDAAVELARQGQVHQHVGRRALHAHCEKHNETKLKEMSSKGGGGAK